MGRKSLDEILEEYIQEVDRDFDFNQMNISTVSYDVIKVKHKWVCRLIRAKKDLIEMERIRNEGIQKISTKLSKESDVPLSIPNAEQKAMRNEKIVNINSIINEQKLLIEYLEKIELMCRNSSQKYNPYLSDRKYLIRPNGEFIFGIYEQIEKEALDINSETKIIYDESFQEYLDNASFSKITEKIYELPMLMRDYQEKAYNIVAERGFGLVEMATGAGKTLWTAYLAYNFLKHYGMDKKVLILVPDLGLVEKTKLDFDGECGLEGLFSIWTGKNKLDNSKPIIVANNAIALSRIDENEWIFDVDLLLYDEAHTCNIDNGIYKRVIRNIKTPRKVGFTGTIPNDAFEKKCLVGVFGEIVYQKKAYQLRSRGYVSNCEVLACKMTYEDKPDYMSDVDEITNYNIEVDFIINNPFRNKLIKHFSKQLEGNCLILVDRIIHGEILLEKLSKLENKEVFFVQGNMPVDERQKIIDKMEVQTNICCIAMSKIFSTGINIKNLPNIIFGQIGKSKRKVIQSIGRGLRKHENKEKLLIIDIYDNLIFARKHFNERKILYDEEKIKYFMKSIKEKSEDETND
jgi:superfamily II DNA or RNA helicase